MKYDKTMYALDLCVLFVLGVNIIIFSNSATWFGNIPLLDTFITLVASVFFYHEAKYIKKNYEN